VKAAMFCLLLGTVAANAMACRPGHRLAVAPRQRLLRRGVVVQRVSVARLGGSRQARNHPNEPPKVAGPLHRPGVTIGNGWEALCIGKGTFSGLASSCSVDASACATDAVSGG
jgi:hypothetical protein